MKWKQPKIVNGKLTKWNWMVQHKDNLTIQHGVDLGAFCYINAKHGVVIKRGAMIGSHCSIYTVSTIDNKKGPVFIGEGARIGTHSTIMPGVVIGNGATVAAYSFVKGNVPPYSTVGGIPARRWLSDTL